MSQPKSPLRVVVVGAGAFGGWTALQLARAGAAVTLVDAWGPGHVRASSGGETRIIRATYGSRAVYTRMAQRALELWRSFDRERALLRETGVLWTFGDDSGFGDASARTLEACGASIERLTPAQVERRYPQMSCADASAAFFEPDAGYLHARRACREVVRRFILDGGTYRQAAVLAPQPIAGDRLTRLETSDGTALEADAFVFACGPWLPGLFPDVVGRLVAATRQEVYYFGTPPGDGRFTDERLPVWIDVGERQIYGVPASGASGFKVADDASGEEMDPTSDERVVRDGGVDRVREFLGRRFPALAQAPLVGAEVCQYESTPDAHLIVDRHPAAGNVWIVGGGSGHGFKLGPALGEMVSAMVVDAAPIEPQFGLARFASAPRDGWEKKWL